MNEALQNFPSQRARRSKLASRPIIGWRERIDLPDLGLFGLAAKIDTGAKTSSLHVDHIEQIPSDDGESWAMITRKTRDSRGSLSARTWRVKIKNYREVKSSNGSTEHRAIIHTNITIGHLNYDIEINLTDRSLMRYQMLVGRSALRRKFLIDPSRSYLLST